MSTVDDLLDRVRDNRVDLPPVYVTEQNRDVVAASMEAVTRANDPPTVFVRGGEIVRLRDDENGRPILEPMSEAAMALKVAQSANFLKVTKGGETSTASVPRLIVQEVLAHPDPPFPGVRAIVELPTTREDGSVLETPGYDSATRLIYRPAPDLVIPPVSVKPSDEEVAVARRLICDDLLMDFPFDDDGGASRANLISAILERVTRPLIGGSMPLHLIDKPQRGTGASLITDILAIIATGQRAPMQSYIPDAAELRKQLTATLSASPQFVHFDDVRDVLSSNELSKVLTSGFHRDRLLGQSRIVDFPVLCSWTATGNNVQVGGDMVRRIALTRLNARMEKPWTRSQFRIPDLLAWTAKNRGRLVWALLTMTRAWIVADRPAGPKISFGSFQSWADVMSGILTFAGIDGFMANAATFEDMADDDGSRWSEFVARWHSLIGTAAVTAAEVASRIEDSPGAWGEAVPDMPQKKGSSQPLSQRLAYRLKSRRDVVFGDFILRRSEVKDPTSRTAKWQVLPKDSDPSFALSNTNRRIAKDETANLSTRGRAHTWDGPSDPSSSFAEDHGTNGHKPLVTATRVVGSFEEEDLAF